MGGRTDGRTDGPTDGPTDGRTDATEGRHLARRIEQGTSCIFIREVFYSAPRKCKDGE